MMKSRFYLLVFAYQITHLLSARFLFKSKHEGLYNRVVVAKPVKVDWSCGEVPWDFKDEANATSARPSNHSSYKIDK